MIINDGISDNAAPTIPIPVISNETETGTTVENSSSTPANNLTDGLANPITENTSTAEQISTEGSTTTEIIQ